MKIQVNTSNSVDGSAKLNDVVQDAVRSSIGRFARRLTRVEVHIADENAGKKGPNDKRCVIEVRPASQQPMSTSADGDTVMKAVTSAASKMKRKLSTWLDKQ